MRRSFRTPRLRTILMLLFLGSLSVLLAVSIIAIQALLPAFYETQSKKTMVCAYETICQQGLDATGQANLEVMAQLERENLSIVLFDPASSRVFYTSHIEEAYLSDISIWLADYLTEALEAVPERYLIEIATPNETTTAGVPVRYGSSLCLGGWVGTYLVSITMPLESVRQTADISIRLMAEIALSIMVAALVVVAVVSSRVTVPLGDMTKAAHQIAALDFSQKCAVTGGRELRELAHSINRMSDRMQGYIQQLHDEIAEKDRSNLARKNLIANLSHDLKTPIGLVAGYAEGLSAGMARTPEQVREYCDIILDETARMNSIISRMLELSRLESGTVTLVPESLDLTELLEAILSHFSHLAQWDQITVHTDLEPALLVTADEFALEQVLTNLIQNAISHISGERIVRLRAHRRGESVRVEVENTAEPIPPEELSRLWDSFYRRDRSRTRRGSEAGLGLAVVRGNLELMGAPYGVYLVEDGICFWLELR